MYVTNVAGQIYGEDHPVKYKVTLVQHASYSLVSFVSLKQQIIYACFMFGVKRNQEKLKPLIIVCCSCGDWGDKTSQLSVEELINKSYNFNFSLLNELMYPLLALSISPPFFPYGFLLHLFFELRHIWVVPKRRNQRGIHSLKQKETL